MPEVTQEIRDEVREIVYDFFAEECEVEKETISDDTNVIEDLEGDSLMFLELIEIFKAKYSLEVSVKTIGEYTMKHPAETVVKVLELILLVIEHGEKIAEMD